MVLDPGQVPQVMTVPEMARVLKIAKSEAYKLIGQGEIPVIRIGKAIRIARDPFLAWLQSKVS
jgi:excisionase family DNA binding protein